MAEHVIKQGLSLPINGKPSNEISDGGAVTRVAVLGHDYPTMKPRMHVDVGDTVKRGQLLFEDRKSEGIRFTAPGAGEVVAIHRGEKRKFLSMVIELSVSEQNGDSMSRVRRCSSRLPVLVASPVVCLVAQAPTGWGERPGWRLLLAPKRRACTA